MILIRVISLRFEFIIDGQDARSGLVLYPFILFYFFFSLFFVVFPFLLFLRILGVFLATDRVVQSLEGRDNPEERRQE